jgi:hypothetical protein
MKKLPIDICIESLADSAVAAEMVLPDMIQHIVEGTSFDRAVIPFDHVWRFHQEWLARLLLVRLIETLGGPGNQTAKLILARGLVLSSRFPAIRLSIVESLRATNSTSTADDPLVELLPGIANMSADAFLCSFDAMVELRTQGAVLRLLRS